MKIFDIYRLEHNNKNVCYLIKDGLFWKAWEKSAMLFQKVIKPYDIKTKHFKGINATMVYLGFPDQYLKTIKDKCIAEDFQFLPDGNKIKITGFENGDGFEEWKEALISYAQNVSEPNTAYASETIISNSTGWLTEEIAKFPLAVKNPFECQQFIYELQQKLNGTI